MAAWRSPQWNRYPVLAYDADADDDPLNEHQELVEYDTEDADAAVSEEDDKNIPPSVRMGLREAPGAEAAPTEPTPDPGEPAGVSDLPEEEIEETDPEFQGEHEPPDDAEMAERAEQIDTEATAAQNKILGTPPIAADSKLGWLAQRLRWR